MSIYNKLDPFLEMIMPFLRRAEQFFGPDDDWVEDDRRILFEWLQRRYGDTHTFIYNMGTKDYVTTVRASPEAVERALMNDAYQRNLLSARKYREHHDGGRQWAYGSYVIDYPHTEWQHHVFTFEAPDGGTDVYAHRETSVLEGKEHLIDPQDHADPHDLYALFDDIGFKYGERDI